MYGHFRSNDVLAPVWAMIVCHTVGNWGFYSFINLMPKFMGNYQQYDIKSIGWMTSIPYLLQTVTVLCATWLSDYLRAGIGAMAH